MALSMMQTLIKFLKYIWPLPYTLIGLGLGAVAMLFGAKAQVISGVVEFQGGFISRLIAQLPMLNRFVAITLGHTISAKNASVLNAYRAHEHVHVKQYERWGIFFVPVYLIFSIWALMQGKRPYFENKFEQEAYRKSEIKKGEV